MRLSKKTPFPPIGLMYLSNKDTTYSAPFCFPFSKPLCCCFCYCKHETMTLEVDCCSLLAEVNMQGRLRAAKPVKPSFNMMESLAREKYSLIHHHIANTLHRDPKWLLGKR